MDRISAGGRTDAAKRRQTFEKANHPGTNRSCTKRSLDDLLPAAFGPEHLGIAERLMPSTGQRPAIKESAGRGCRLCSRRASG
jgi:hypothetical protein